MMLHNPKSLLSSVKIGLLNLNYSSYGSCPREIVFTMLYVCKTDTTHVEEAFYLILICEKNITIFVFYH